METTRVLLNAKADPNTSYEYLPVRSQVSISFFLSRSRVLFFSLPYLFLFLSVCHVPLCFGALLMRSAQASEKDVKKAVAAEENDRNALLQKVSLHCDQKDVKTARKIRHKEINSKRKWHTLEKLVHAHSGGIRHRGHHNAVSVPFVDFDVPIVRLDKK